MFYFADKHAHDDSSENESEEEGDMNIPLQTMINDATLETIQSRLQSVEKQDAIAQLLESAQQISKTVLHMSSAMANMQREMNIMKEERQKDRDLMKRMYSELQQLNSSGDTPRRATSTPTTPSTSTASVPATPVSGSTRASSSLLSPRYINAPTADQLLLGGDQGMVRDVSWYGKVLHQVSWKKKDNDMDNGRLLCMKLLRCEFSKEDLASKNVSGFSRNGDNKKIRMEKLDQRVLTAIFNQAKYQFPNFEQWYTDTKCTTVKELNNICQKARKDLEKQNEDQE